MPYEASIEIFKSYLDSVSRQYQLGLYFSESLKYLLDVKGRICANVYWTRRTYRSDEREFDTYDNYLAIKKSGRYVRCQLLNKYNGELIVDSLVMNWSGNSRDEIMFFEDVNLMWDDREIRDFYCTDPAHERVII